MSMISQLLAPVRPVPMIGVIYDQKFFDAGKNITNRPSIANASRISARKYPQDERGAQEGSGR